MKPIMIVRVTHVLSFTEILQAIGAPLERELGRVSLPTMLERQPDAYVPVLPVLKFIRHMEHKEGIDDIAFLASQRVSFDRLSGEFIDMCQSVPTLYARLLLFSQFTALESSYCRLLLIHEGSDFRICNNLTGHPGLEGLHYSEWLQITVLIDIVRKTLGYKWSPAEITFQSQFSPSDGAFEKYPNTRFLFGQKNTSITVPASLMSQSLHREHKNKKWHSGNAAILKNVADPEQDFPGSLKLALRSYFQEDYPDVNLAAEITNTSVRTLQRRLGEFGLNYSTLVQQARFEAATDLLTDPGLKILDVAHAVGFSDPSHFARSFRSIAGVSPGEYRRQQFDHIHLTSKSRPTGW